MFSESLKRALEREIIGQTRAVNTIVRGVTRLVSGVTPRERTLCGYLFMGPTGTGKTHVIQSLTRILHGDEPRSVVIDSTDFLQRDPREVLAQQLVPLFTPDRHGHPWPQPATGIDAAPLSIVQIEFLERAPKEVLKPLGALLETGQVMLPDGRRGHLRNCLVFVTSGLCSSEILDEVTRIGFSGTALDEDGDEEDQLHQSCLHDAEQAFGSEVVGRFDRVIVFHRLQEEHLGEILRLRAIRLGRWLAERGFQCELTDAARAFLLQKGCHDLRRGALDLIRAHQTFVEFPVADLLVSGRVPPRGSILVDRQAGEEHLHFTVVENPAVETPPEARLREILVS